MPQRRVLVSKKPSTWCSHDLWGSLKMKLLRIFRGPERRQAQPSWEVVMVRQIFLPQTSKQRSVPSERAAGQAAILILIYASSLAGCANSLNQTAGDGGPGLRAFQSNPDGSNALDFQPTASSGTQRDAQTL